MLPTALRGPVLVMCDSRLTDKGNGCQTDRKMQKNTIPVMEVTSVAVNVDAEVVRAATIPNERFTNVRVTNV